MRTLYESILDDEDEVLDKIEDISKNPLNVLIRTIEKGDKQQIESLVQNGILDDFFKDVLGLDIKLFEVGVVRGRITWIIRFTFRYDDIVSLYYLHGGRNIDILLATKKFIETKYKYTVLDNTSLCTNRRKISQNLKKLGYVKHYYRNKNYDYYSIE